MNKNISMSIRVSDEELEKIKKAAEKQQMQQQLSVKDFRHSVFLDPLLIHVK